MVNETELGTKAQQTRSAKLFKSLIAKTIQQETLEQDYIEQVRTEIEQGIVLTVTDRKSGDNFFHLAAKLGDQEIAEMMLKKLSADKDSSALKKILNTKNKDGKTPYDLAMEKGDSKTAKLLNKYGSLTPTERLSEATLSSKTLKEEVQDLIAKGAKVKVAQKSSGNTFLHQAVISGNTQALQAILESGKVDEKYINAKNKDGDTALDLASPGRHSSSEELASLLVKHGANINFMEKQGKTFLHQVVEDNDHEKVRELVKKQVELDVQDSRSGQTALHIAIINGHEDIAKIIIEAGASLSIRDKNGDTVLDIAKQTGSEDVVKFLVDKGMTEEKPKSTSITQNKLRDAILTRDLGSDILKKLIRENGDLLDIGPLDQGNSIFHLAAQSGNTQAMQEILSRQSLSSELINHNGETPLSIAAKNNDLSMVDVITKDGSFISVGSAISDNPMHHAIRNNNKDMLITLLRDANGLAYINYVNQKSEETTLDCAIACGNDEIAKMLVEQGGTSNKAYKFGSSMLHMAIKEKLESTTELLIQKSTDLNQTDEKQQTALHLAVENNDLTLVTTLINAGADADLKDKEGKTPLHLAVKHDDKELIKRLFNNGADLDAKDNDGKTPLDIARALDLPKAINELEALQIERSGRDKEQKVEDPSESSPEQDPPSLDQEVLPEPLKATTDMKLDPKPGTVDKKDSKTKADKEKTLEELQEFSPEQDPSKPGKPKDILLDQDPGAVANKESSRLQKHTEPKIKFTFKEKVKIAVKVAIRSIKAVTLKPFMKLAKNRFDIESAKNDVSFDSQVDKKTKAIIIKVYNKVVESHKKQYTNNQSQNNPQSRPGSDAKKLNASTTKMKPQKDVQAQPTAQPGVNTLPVQLTSEDKKKFDAVKRELHDDDMRRSSKSKKTLKSDTASRTPATSNTRIGSSQGRVG